jgi:hypothetical protein
MFINKRLIDDPLISEISQAQLSDVKRGDSSSPSFPGTRVSQYNMLRIPVTHMYDSA